jgi:hypothetical protein
MPRNRIIYQSEALYAGPTPATGFHFRNSATEGTNLVDQLQRVQTANYSFTVDRTDVNQFGQLAAIDRVILTSPTVALDFSYILANLTNEYSLGFYVQSGTQPEVSAISGILSKVEDEKNFFIKTVTEGADAVGNTDTSNNVGVIGIGNGFVASYTTEGSVGNFPTASVNVEGLNMVFQNGVSGNIIPAINPENGQEIGNIKYALPVAASSTAINTVGASGISALRPGDITLSLPTTIGANTATFNIQSYSLSFDLTRTPIERLGSKFAFAREIDFPVTVSMSVDAQVTDLSAGTLAQLVSGDSSTFYNPSIFIKNPTLVDQTVVRYTLKRAKLDSQEFSSDIGSNKSVTLNFSSQVGGPEDRANGLFFSGLY